MPEVETTIEATRPTEQANEPAVAQPPTAWMSKIDSGKGLKHPGIRRSGRGAAPEPKAEPAMPQAAELPATQVTTQIPATEPAKEQPVVEEPKGPRVFQAHNPDDLIQFLGDAKPRTTNQILSELGQARSINQREGRLNAREQQLAERENRLLELEQRITATRPSIQEPAPAPVTDAPPPRPANAIEGDEEWTRWQAQLTAYELSKTLDSKIDQKLAPVVNAFKSQQETRDAEQKAQREAQERYSRNDATYASALLEHLPFDPRGLSQEAFDQVNAKVREELLEADPNLDIFDQNKMSSVELPVTTAKLAIKLAFPKGSLPPGHTQANPMTEAAKPADGPLVAPVPQKPLPNTQVSTSPPKDTRGVPRPGHTVRWDDKLRGNGGSLQPVSIRRSPDRHSP